MSERIPYTREELYGLGPRPAYEGAELGRIAFPLGGIGTGSVSLSGRGMLIDWEIFNRPNKPSRLPFTFTALWAQRAGDTPVARVLAGPPQPPFDGANSNSAEPSLGSGVPRDTLAGLPHMRHVSFRGEYPYAWLTFSDPRLPLEVSLEAYNPFIPLNADDSSLPVAILRYTLRNPGDRPVRAVLAASQFNAVGYGGGTVDGAGLGGNVNTPFAEAGLRGLTMTSERYAAEAPQFGSLVLATPWMAGSYTTAWLRTGWFDALQGFWDAFAGRGEFVERTYGPSPDRQSDVGTLGLSVSLAPGESAVLPIYIAWYFPNFGLYFHQSGDPQGEPANKITWRNHYATLHADARAVARYVVQHEDRLRGETLRFHDALFGSTLPPYVLDAVSSQASILKSTTCLRLTDGSFYGFEGCHARTGCCEGSCTHVWNYAQTMAFLFPDLERTLREADYAFNLGPDGHMGFRQILPPGSRRWDFYAAADGQMGGIVKVYREWKLSGNTDWLRGLWPKVKKALAYAWQVWDVDRDGVMEGIQHNTYDIEFWGPNSMMGTFYLAALRAGEEMARALGEPAQAEEYRRIYESGRSKMQREQFNGEYFEQHINPEAHLVAPVDLSKSMGGQTPEVLKYQYGTGCLADQVIGQWLAHVAGLGDLLDAGYIRKALQAVLQYNWRTDFWEHNNCQRVYAINDEAGLLLCTWPRGGRPALPFPYSDEVWPGIEYQVASHMIYEGLVDEGLAIVRGLRLRHDGVRRNPWNEVECGSHYARSLASWSVLLALSGFTYDMTRGRLGFAPRLKQDVFGTFWSVDGAWGAYTQEKDGDGLTAKLRVDYGRLSLRELQVGDKAFRRVRATLGEHELAAEVGPDGSVAFAEPAALEAGQELVVSLQH